MARVAFTPNLRRHVDCPDVVQEGESVRVVLDGVFARLPQLRGYVLDDQDRLRTHMVIFVDGVVIKDRDTLSDRVLRGSEIYVMQALSGG